MLDICAGLLATAKGCLKHPAQHVFVGYSKNSVCFHNVLLSLLEVNPKQVLSPNYVITGSEEEVEASTVFVKEMKAFLSKRKG